MRYLGIIPARGGSKRIPNKNTRLLGDTPLLGYTVRAAQESRYLDNFFVSTEDEKIRILTLSYGAPVLHRPASLAEDDITTGEVVVHAIEAMEADGQKYDAVVILHPTSPLRNGRHIDEAIERYEEYGRPALASVVRVPQKSHPNMGQITVRGWEPVTDRLLFQLNAAIYIREWDDMRQTASHTAKVMTPYIMSHADSIDIDDELDWRIAEMIVRQNEGTRRHHG